MVMEVSDFVNMFLSNTWFYKVGPPGYNLVYRPFKCSLAKTSTYPGYNFTGRMLTPLYLLGEAKLVIASLRSTAGCGQFAAGNR